MKEETRDNKEVKQDFGALNEKRQLLEQMDLSMEEKLDWLEEIHKIITFMQEHNKKNSQCEKKNSS
jgi:hypothetical protein